MYMIHKGIMNSNLKFRAFSGLFMGPQQIRVRT